VSIDYRIDRARRCVLSTGSGELSYKDGLGHMDRLSADPDFDPTFSQLIDFAGFTKVTLSHDEIYDLASRHVFAPDARRAFVTTTMEQFGLARMFQSYRSVKGETGIRVFMSMEEAIAWLGLNEDGPPGATPEG
jgi:hypothetical protein